MEARAGLNKAAATPMRAPVALSPDREQRYLVGHKAGSGDRRQGTGRSMQETSGDQGRVEHGRLDTWKAIASHFGRDVRTAKRWERQRGMPVHRLPGGGGQVYAYAAELDSWLRAGSRAGEAQPDRPEKAAGPQRRWTAALAVAVIGMAGMAAIFSASHLTAPHLTAAALPAAGLHDSAAVRLKHQPEAEAQRLYLKGLYEWNTRTPEGLHQAVEDYTASIARDPQYALPYVGLANCYNLLREYARMPAEIAYPMAKAAAERAVALDDSLSDAHSALGFIDFFWSWDEASAEREFQRAITLDPHSAIAHHWYATTLMHMGRAREALAEIRKAEALQPESAAIRADEALILLKTGRVAEATSLLQAMERTDPSFQSPHRYLIEAALVSHNWPAFIEEKRRLAELEGDRASLVEAFQAKKALEHGGPGEMFTTLARLGQERFEAGRLGALELARAYALSGDRERMLAMLAVAVARREPNLVGIGVDAAFAPYQKDKTFARTVARAGPVRRLGWSGRQPEQPTA